MEETYKDTEEQKDNFNVDKALDRLEEINELLGKPDIELKTSLELYKEGALLAARCKEELEGIRRELDIVNGENN